MTKEESDLVKAAEDRYKLGNVGWKIVEAILIPSANSGNNEANKLKIIKYIHEKRYKIDSVKMIALKWFWKSRDVL